MKQYKPFGKEPSKSTNPLENDSSKQGKRRREPTEPLNGKQSPPIIPQHLESTHCLAVAKGLLALLLAMDHSCSADMFLLSCKVSFCY